MPHHRQRQVVRCLASVILAGSVLTGGSGGHAEEPGGSDAGPDAALDFSALGDEAAGLSPEFLLFQDIPTVTLATKHAQPITLAPASISVITAEDIRRQGARTIPDLLRNVPGINVNRIDNSDVNVAARFPADNNNAEMLVLIDGRTVYLDFFGIVPWDHLPVVLEDIERIEIIRGPASPLYGANAYAGIVNIITKDPADHPTSTLSASVGTQDRYIGSYIYTGSQGNWRYKAVASWDEINEFSPRDENAREDLKVYTTHIYDFDDGESLRINMGLDDEDGDTFTGLGSFHSEQQKVFVQGVVKYGDWEGQVFFNRFDGHVSNPLLDPFPNGGLFGVNNPQGRTQIVNNVFNAEFQHVLELFDAHKVTWGGGYRYNQLRGRNIFGANEHLDIFNGFAQDEWAVTDDLMLTASVRADQRQLTDVTISPRVAAVYQWREDHVFRASISQAFRDPTQVESFLDITGGQVFTVVPGPGTPVPIVARGNRDLDPMEITSFEGGYNGRYFDDALHVKVDVFFNELDEVIEFFSPSPGLFTFQNVGGADQYGGEIELEYYWKPWLRPYANYSLLYFRAQSNRVLGSLQSRGNKIRSAPQHTFNVGVIADWENGWSAMAQLHWVDDRVEDFLNPTPMFAGPPFPGPPASPTALAGRLDEYARVDARVGYHIEEPDLELSLSAFNLLNDRHREHPLGQPLGRQVVFNVLWKF